MWTRLKVLAVSAAMLCAVVAGLPQLYGQTEGEDFILEQGVVYKHIAEDNNLTLNIAFPPKGEGPFPCIIYVPWTGVASYNTLAAINASLKGYVSAVVDYRRIAAFPTPIVDVKCAIRWLADHAKEYKINPSRIIVIGIEFGGYLALMATYTDESQISSADCVSVSMNYMIKAIVSLGAPTEWSTIDPTFYSSLPGPNSERREEFRAKGSPLVWIGKNTPPTFIFHGALNKIVPIGNSQMLDEKLARQGVEHVFVNLKDEGREIQDHWSDQVVWDFIKTHLK